MYISFILVLPKVVTVMKRVTFFGPLYNKTDEMLKMAVLQTTQECL